MIEVGDTVRCIGPAGVDDILRPSDRPVVGEVYTVTSIYSTSYGLGCLLDGLDPAPYRGYLLFVHTPMRGTDMAKGWYFEKLPDIQLPALTTAEAFHPVTIEW